MTYVSKYFCSVKVDNNYTLTNLLRSVDNFSPESFNRASRVKYALFKKQGTQTTSNTKSNHH